MELWEFHSFTASSTPKKNAGKGRLSSGFLASFDFGIFCLQGLLLLVLGWLIYNSAKDSAYICLPLVQLVMFFAMSEKKTCLPDLLTLKVV